MKRVKFIVKDSFLFQCYQEWLVRRCETQRFLEEAKEHFMREKNLKGSFSGYRHDCHAYRVDYAEYMYQYEFWGLTEKEKKEFVSRAEMQSVYRRMVKPEIRRCFYNKSLFLQRYSSNVHRKWLVAREASFEQFLEMVGSFDCIAKPIDGTLGNGIFKIKRGHPTNGRMLYDDCVKKNILVEECVVGCDELEAFHPASLNTIRVVTISNEEKDVVFGAFLRMGNNGRCVDNAHAGGIFAQINVESGIVESDGVTTGGMNFSTHPYSGILIKGFKIPRWEEIKNVCVKAAKVMPGTYFVGWDVCILQDGQIELIEANHAPDFDLMQSPLKRGVRQKLNTVMEELFDCNLNNYFYKHKRHARKK